MLHLSSQLWTTSWANHPDRLCFNDELSDSSSFSSASETSHSLPSQKRRHKHLTNNRNRHKSKFNKKTLSIDCEMVGVGESGYRSALARVVIVSWTGNIVMDQHVLPTEPVTDYRTFVSGITKQDLEQPGVIDLDSCRAKVMELLRGKILVGHGLDNDLEALGITHPWFLTRDTSKWEPFMKLRPLDHKHHVPVFLCPRKLKELCSEKLDREIQLIGQPHSPIEDAMAALDLYKLVRQQWEETMFGMINKCTGYKNEFWSNSSHQQVFYQQLVQFLQKDIEKQRR